MCVHRYPAVPNWNGIAVPRLPDGARIAQAMVVGWEMDGDAGFRRDDLYRFRGAEVLAQHVIGHDEDPWNVRMANQTDRRRHRRNGLGRRGGIQHIGCRIGLRSVVCAGDSPVGDFDRLHADQSVHVTFIQLVAGPLDGRPRNGVELSMGPFIEYRFIVVAADEHIGVGECEFKAPGAGPYPTIFRR